jgi:outer membrane immunogenic protein
MRALFVAAVAAVFAPTFAVASDLAVKAPRAIAVSNWSGVYVGANFGYGWSSGDWTNINNTSLFGDALPGEGLTGGLNGILGGGQFGINFQSGSWVYGVEALIDVANIDGKQSNSFPFGAADDQFNANINVLMLGTVRLGYSWNDWLGYVKGGYALALVRASVNDGTPPTVGSGSDSSWRSGPTVGAGIEYALAPNWSLGLEYDYVHLDGDDYQLGDSTGSYLWHLDVENVHLVMVRLNYRFSGWP